VSFKATLKNSRVLEDTTFVLEPIVELDSEHPNEFSKMVDFSVDKYSIAPNGGAIAVAHEKNRDSNGYYKKICVYDSYCNLIQTFALKYECSLRKIYITPEECLLLVFSNGTVASYQLRGLFLSENTLYDKAVVSVSFASFWSRGLFLVGTNNKIYIFDDLATLKPRLFCHYAGNTLLEGVAIPGDVINNRSPILWCYDTIGQIVLIQENSYDIAKLPEPVTSLAFSSDFSMIIAKCNNRFLLCEQDFKRIILNVVFDDVESDRIVWCGNDSFLILKDSLVVMIGASRDAIKWSMESPVAAVAETDGARVFTSNGVYLLRALSPAVLEFALWNVKSISVELFTLILDEKGLAMKDPLLSYSLSEVLDATKAMLEAAMFFRFFKQRSALMKAIARIMLMTKKPQMDGSEESDIISQIKDFALFSDRLSTLRAVEQLVRPPYNIPITVPQFIDITSSVLLKRLCNRSLHYEAYRVAQYMGVESNFISAHWANCLIHTDLTSDKILKRILDMKEPVDYIDLATTSFEIGKNDLALNLISHNPAKARAVPLLIARKKWNEALDAAVDSSDASLIIYALEMARDAKQNEPIQTILEKSKVARDIWHKMDISDEERIKNLKMNKRDLLYRIKDKLSSAGSFEEMKKIIRMVDDSFESKVVDMFASLNPIKQWLISQKQIANIDNLTPVQIFQEVVLTENKLKMYETADILGYTNDEILWGRLITGVLRNSIPVLKQLQRDFKKYGVPEKFMNYAVKHNSIIAQKILRGEPVEDPKPEEPIKEEKSEQSEQKDNSSSEKPQENNDKAEKKKEKKARHEAREKKHRSKRSKKEEEPEQPKE